MISLALGGDVMTGRGVDQCLTYSVKPLLQEPWVRKATEYVYLAERKSGKIIRPLSYQKVWGQLLLDLKEFTPDLFLANLETSVTTSPTFFPGKEVHYRMHPKNVELLTLLQPCIFALANNHLGDFGKQGILETLKVLDENRILSAGAGRNFEEASRPAVFDLKEKGRLLFFSAGLSSSGIPNEWRANEKEPGVFLLQEPLEQNLNLIEKLIVKWKKKNDLILWSFHWGSNWGYEILEEHQQLARKLIELGFADLIHGHSSHHAKSFEVYQKKLILFGCGDLISDYEGITGYETYRPELKVLFCPNLSPISGELDSLKLCYYKVKGLEILQANQEERQWLEARVRTPSAHLPKSLFFRKLY